MNFRDVNESVSISTQRTGEIVLNNEEIKKKYHEELVWWNASLTQELAFVQCSALKRKNTAAFQIPGGGGGRERQRK